MKKSFTTLFVGALLSLNSLSAAQEAASSAMHAPLKVGIVNFKLVVEESKLGKQEQANFEVLKKQMEAVLEDKEKVLTEISAKFNDPDYIDSLSPEAENELKHKFRTLNQELGQIQSQYYQTLNQANVKILQQLNELVAQASEKVANRNQLDLVLNDDGGFYYSKALDISKQVITELDTLFEKELKNDKKVTSSVLP